MPSMPIQGPIWSSPNLRSAIAAANDAIFNHSRQHAGQSGMGTTVAMMVVHQNQVQIANVGDSRVYAVRSGKLTQVTTDHFVG